MSRQSQDLYTSVQTAHNKIDKLDKRITALEEKFESTLPSFEDVKGIFKEKPACDTCIHALELDRYDDILCLRASVWQHPRFESPDTTDCDHHDEREDK